MLIAHLEKIDYSVGDNEHWDAGVAYCGTDPYDGEMLTPWLDSILAVDAHLMENTDGVYGLNIGAYRGESDVPERPLDEEPESHIPCE